MRITDNDMQMNEAFQSKTQRWCLPEEIHCEVGVGFGYVLIGADSDTS